MWTNTDHIFFDAIKDPIITVLVLAITNSNTASIMDTIALNEVIYTVIA
jgi:catabolite regulation protein CreA